MPKAKPADDAARIDALYGLEPVYEPGEAAGAPTEFITVECPYCWERYDTQIDLSGGAFAYVEDCQVCCRPIELAVEVDGEGALDAVRFTRVD